MQLIPWNRPRGALHSLAHWSEIDEGARSLLLLSDRTLYVIQNLVGLDVGMRSRWIADQNDLGYYPPEPGSDDDDVFKAAVALAEEEVRPLTGIGHLLYDIGYDFSTSLVSTGGQVTLYYPSYGTFDTPLRLDAFSVAITAARGYLYTAVSYSSGQPQILSYWNAPSPLRDDKQPALLLPAGSRIYVVWDNTQNGDTLYLRGRLTQLLGEWS